MPSPADALPAPFWEIATTLLGAKAAAELFAPTPGPRRFGAEALKVEGKIFAMMSRGRFVVKLPKARVAALIAEGAGEAFDAGKGRALKEWVALAPDRETLWLPLAREARTFVAGAATGAAHRRNAP